MPPLSDLLAHHHALVEHLVPQGGTVLDATMGNGHDTLFLARLIGEHGFVLAMDKQAAALESTRTLLEKEGMSSAGNIQLVMADHKDMAEILATRLAAAKSLNPSLSAELHAALFNLGFLPGADKTLTTHPATTIPALHAVWQHMALGGFLSVHVYTGHAGGAEEAEQVAQWMADLPRQQARVIALTQHNKPKNKETLYLATKYKSAP